MRLFGVGTYDVPLVDRSASTRQWVAAATVVAASVDYTDAATASLLLTPSAAEGLEHTDADTEALALTPALVDESHVISDANTEAFALTPSAADVAAFVDSDTGVTLLTLAAADIIGAVDAIVETFTFTISATELQGFIEQATEELLLTPTLVSEVHEISDANTENFALTPSGSDVFTLGPVDYTDSATETFALTPSATETAQRVDADTELFALTPSAVEGLEHTDAATEGLALTPSASDIAVLVDTETELFALTPSAVEVYTGVTAYTDAATETFALTPSGTDLRTITETSDLYFFLDPSPTTWGDDFNDNSLNPNRWTVADLRGFEQNQRLELVQDVASLDARIRERGTSQLPEQTFITLVDWDKSAFESVYFECIGYRTDTGADILAIQFDFTSTSCTTRVRNDVNSQIAGTGSSIPNTNPPQYLRITRLHPGLTVERSADGVTWTDALGGTVTADYKWMHRVYFQIRANSLSKAPGVLLTAFDNFSASQQAVEAVVSVDAGTESLALTPSSSDVIVAVDSGTEVFALTPSSDEVYTSPVFHYEDVGTLDFALTPSTDVETLEAVDSATEELLLTPSTLDEEHITEDAATVGLTLTPTTVVELVEFVEPTVELYFRLTPATVAEALRLIQLVGKLRTQTRYAGRVNLARPAVAVLGHSARIHTRIGNRGTEKRWSMR